MLLTVFCTSLLRNKTFHYVSLIVGNDNDSDIACKRSSMQTKAFNNITTINRQITNVYSKQN